MNESPDYMLDVLREIVDKLPTDDLLKVTFTKLDQHLSNGGTPPDEWE